MTIRLATCLITVLVSCLPAVRPCIAQITPVEAAGLMGRGINLGNTLEPPFEGAWNNPPAREHYFDDFADAGFRTVRIPVRWDEHTQDVSPFAVDETWMDRVGEVLGWALERDLFVIVNAHHDDWVKADYDNPLVKARLDSIWSQIATRFSDAPEKLLFEILNEPFGMTVAQVDEMNERILKIIRRSNPTRIVIFSGNEWSGPSRLLAAAVPDDPYLMGYYHSYDPWDFAGLGNGTWGSESDLQAVAGREAQMRSWWDDTGVPVMHSEFGAVRSNEYNSRMRFYAAYVESMIDAGIPFQVWDDGGNFGIYDRDDRTWDDDVLDLLINAWPDGPTELELAVEQDTNVSITWSNRTLAFSGLRIERAREDGPFVPIAELTATAESFEDAPVEGGTAYRYRVIAVDALRGDRFSYPVRIEVPVFLRSGFGGAPHPVPGSIEAEHFDVGGEGLTYHDSDTQNTGGGLRTETGVDVAAVSEGFHVVDVEPGEWLEYSINVAEPGRYRIRTYVASEEGGGLFYFGAAGEWTKRLSIPQTGAGVTAPVEAEISLAKGTSILRLTILTGDDYSVDRLEIDRLSDTRLDEELHPVTAAAYPNPVGDELVLRLGPVGRNARATVFDPSGRRVLTASVEPGENRLYVGSLAPGTYVVRVSGSGRRDSVFRVVVL